MIDSHCHLNFDSFAEDLDDVLERARQAGVRTFINPAVDLASCRDILALHRRRPEIHVAVGVHPNSSAGFDGGSLRELAELCAQPGVVAVGEIGLDYFRDRCPPDRQQYALRKQLQLAADRGLPVIIHNREADADLMPILEEHVRSLAPGQEGRIGVLHSFSASEGVARQALDLGFHLGFTGPLTFRKADAMRGIARSVPMDRLLVETDAPFLAPAPRRGKRNEPAWLRHIVERLADLHGVTPGAMGRVTEENARRLFCLPH